MTTDVTRYARNGAVRIAYEDPWVARAANRSCWSWAWACPGSGGRRA
ncbi:hypothetical protein [Streptoalloteichus hindustanus]|uniref:Uncharacterized protein n=1 Tax=Streptoalloteichus hindustanus TaxID=2017 RepID=A0A1M5ID62_STRHI|nr:hypothetical protein [Streptoalloteichus hindustanus]SHG25703.1 hypothetical protein SAMN05444320_107212 [Streptoalloteichus hindustanus]